MKEYLLSDIAQMVDGRLIGHDDWTVRALSRIDHAEADTLTYLSDRHYAQYLESDVRRAVLVEEEIELSGTPAQSLIIVDDAHAAICQLAELFQRATFYKKGISASAEVASTTTIDPEVSIGSHSIIKENAQIGQGTVIADQVYIGDRCTIGAHVIIHPGVRIMDDTIIGDHVVIQPNAVVGSDGFGYRMVDGAYQKIPHIGHVVIEDHVEIGANVCIDRAAIGATIIRQGAKLDNLIQIAHGVEVGPHTVIAAQAGISGSSRVGQYARIGGQTGIVGHISIADGSQIQAQSGVASDIKEPGQKWYGYPAMEYWRYLRSFSIFKKLPQLMARIEDLERKIK